MSEVSTDYLLVIHFSATAPDQETSRPQMVIPCVSIRHAMFEILQFPIDQFVLPTAEKLQLKDYISRAVVYDLCGLTTAFTVEADYASTKEGQHLVFIYAEPEISPRLFSDELERKMFSVQTHATRIPFVRYHKGLQCMVPSKCFSDIYEDAVSATINDMTVLVGGRYCVGLDGFSLINHTKEESFQHYPPATHYHFYDDLKAAFSRLMSVPAECFNFETAPWADLPFYFQKALLHSTHNSNPLAAFKIFTKDIVESTGAPGEGLYLLVYNDGLALLEDVYLANADIMMNEVAVAVRLGKWDVVADQTYFTRSASFDYILEHYNTTRIQPLHNTSFNCTKEQYADNIHRMIEGEQVQSKIYFNCHSQLLHVALFELTAHMAEDYDPARLATSADKDGVIKSRIEDANGQTLFCMVDQQLAGAQTPGLYLGVHQQWEKHPVFQQLAHGQLAQGATEQRVQRGDMVYFQIGRYYNNQLRSTLGYSKFIALQRTQYLAQRAREVPGFKKVQHDKTGGKQFVLEYYWALGSEDKTIPVRQFKSLDGYSDPDAVARRIELILKTHRTFIPANAFVGADLMLQRIVLTEGPKRKEILTIEDIADTNTPLQYQYNMAKASKPLHTALVDVVQLLVNIPQPRPPGQSQTRRRSRSFIPKPIVTNKPKKR